jgi:cytosine/adenosine deaminase-related metal-dependent hydrolase
MKKYNVGAVHCASSNFMLSSGVMDVRKFLNEGFINIIIIII